MELEITKIGPEGWGRYAATGCELVDIRRFGYAGCPEVAHEAMLIWHLAL